MSLDEQFAQSYLRRGPPWPGDSHFKDKNVIKELGGRFEGEMKKWVANSYDVVEKLIKSQKWVPVGFSKEGARLVLLGVQGGLSISNEGDQMYFDRRHPKRAKFNPKTDVEKVCGRERTYVRACETCGVLLDSRLQFGLECDCKDGYQWKSCMRCFKPVRSSEECDCPAI